MSSREESGCLLPSRLSSAVMPWSWLVTYREDAPQVGIGNTPRTMASLRNLAIGILRHHGWSNIAEAFATTPSAPCRALAILGITTP